MAGGQHYSSHQRKIITRYYAHRDTIQITKLQELLTEIALAEGKAIDRLWTRALTNLEKLKVEPPIPTSAIEQLRTSRDLEALAKLVNSLDRQR